MDNSPSKEISPRPYQSVISRAGDAFVNQFKREPASASDAAWLNGFVAALGSPSETSRDVADLDVQDLKLSIEHGWVCVRHAIGSLVWSAKIADIPEVGTPFPFDPRPAEN